MRETDVNNYRSILLIFALGLTTTGCVSLQTDPNGPAPVSNAVRKEIGRMAVRAPSKPSVSLTADLDNKGKAAGKTAAAAGVGWLDASFSLAAESDHPLAAVLIAAFGLATAPIVATGGAVYGATVADTDKAIAEGNKVLKDALDFAAARFEHNLQTKMAEKVEMAYVFVPASAVNADLSRLGFDSVMDLQMDTLQSNPSSSKFAIIFSSRNRVLLTALANGRVLAARQYSRQTPKRSVSSLARNNGEVLLAALHHWGPDRALEKFNWMGAFAWFDRTRARLVLARDAGSEKPLYYYTGDQQLLFASEIKTLLTLSGRKFALDRDVVGQFIFRA